MPGTVVGPKIIAAQYIFKGLPLWCLYSWRDKNCNQLKSNMYYSVVRIKLKGHRVTGGCYVSCYLLLLSCLSVSDSVQPHRRQPTRLPVPGILQARTLEWVAISFSSAGKWKVKVKPLSRVRLLATPWILAHQAPPSSGKASLRGCHLSWVRWGSKLFG